MNTLKVRGPWGMESCVLAGDAVMGIMAPGNRLVGYIYTGERWEDQGAARLVAAAPELFLLVADILVDRGEESKGDTLDRLRGKAQRLLARIGGSDE